MASKVLVVFVDVDLAKKTIEHLTRILGSDSYDFVQAGSYAEAVELMTSDGFELLISQLDIPRDDKSPIETGKNVGLELLKWSAANTLSPRPSVLVGPAISNEVNWACMNLPATPVAIEQTYMDDLTRAVQMDLGANAKKRSGQLTITINLDDIKDNSANKFGQWTMKGVSDDGRPLDGNGQFSIEEKNLRLITSFSSMINNRTGTRGMTQQLKDMGDLLMKSIFHENRRLNDALTRCVALLGDDFGKSSVCFRTNHFTHDFLLETVADDEKFPRTFWSLSAPIYRRIGGYGVNRAPLGLVNEAGEKSINCLIVNASVAGTVGDLTDENGNELTLGELTHADNECNALVDLLRTRGRKFGVDRVVPMTRQVVGDNSFRELFTNELKTKRWDVIHFIGHSYFDRPNNAGYLFFPSRREGARPEKVLVDAFAQYLQKVNFLFMSSCESATSSFFTVMARCMVPAVVGYRWPVADDRATEFAKKFYEELFGGDSAMPTVPRMLQNAFAGAQRRMHELHPKEDTWIAPILLLQTS